MSKRGPKKTPNTVKISHGTHRRDRDGDPSLEPGTPLVDCPQPPESLGDDGRNVWLEELSKIIQAGYFTQLDLRSFETYCRTFDEVSRLDAVLESQGEYFVAESGYMGQHPAVNARFKWLDIRRRYEEAFWMNPTARAGKNVRSKNDSGVDRRKRG